MASFPYRILNKSTCKYDINPTSGTNRMTVEKHILLHATSPINRCPLCSGSDGGYSPLILQWYEGWLKYQEDPTDPEAQAAAKLAPIIIGIGGTVTPDNYDQYNDALNKMTEEDLKPWSTDVGFIAGTMGQGGSGDGSGCNCPPITEFTAEEVQKAFEDEFWSDPSDN